MNNEQEIKDCQEKLLDSVKTQLVEQYQLAFTDLLRENLESETPDWGWVQRLHAELRDRICNLTPNRVDIHVDIHDKMDSEIFYSMISHGSFDSVNLQALINFVFTRIRELEAPAKNTITDEKLQEILELFQSENATIATIVPVFIQAANERLDDVYNDKEIFMAFLAKQKK
tara:strand:+ start:2911 stop:3426 length:516 start_codon:yes stop_codon:yes gene_type:complete